MRTCEPDDDLSTAMAIMRRARVRRLAVAEGGKLAGILALNDIILAAEHNHGAVASEEVMDTMMAVSEHRIHKSARASVAPSHWPPIPVAVA